VFEQLQAVLLDELVAAGRIDLERVSVDSSACRPSKRGLTGANPVVEASVGPSCRWPAPPMGWRWQLAA
jgi:hypothetical protein